MMKTHRLRVLFLLVASMATFTVIEARLFYVQILRGEHYRELARNQQIKTEMLMPRRGDIVDRNGQVLATSYLRDTIYLDVIQLRKPERDTARELAQWLAPEQDDPAALAAHIRQCFSRPEREVLANPTPPELRPRLERLERTCGLPEGALVVDECVSVDGQPIAERDRRLVKEMARILRRPEPIYRRLMQRQRRHRLIAKAPEAIRQAFTMLEHELNLNGNVIVYENHSKRAYPNDSLAGHVLGFTTIDEYGDNKGLAGLELAFDDWLKGNYTRQRVPVNSLRQGLAPLADETVEATYGHDLVLTIDRQIQMFTERALRRQVGQTQARAGAAVVMDVKTGAILALANCPDFDPNQFARSRAAQRRNRALTDPIEIGSVMKIITTALLLDQGLLSPDEQVDCQEGYAVFGRRVIKDAHPLGVVPFREAFAESSNIAMATLGLRLEPTVYFKGLRRFGLGQPTGVDLPGESGGILHPLQQWTGMSRTSLPIGYEAALTPLQVVAAVGAKPDTLRTNGDRITGGQRQQNHVAIGHHGGFNVVFGVMPLGDINIRGQRRAGHHFVHGADINNLVGNALGLTYGPGRFQFTHMALAIVERQGMYPVTPGPSQVQQREGIHPSGVNHNNGVSHWRITRIASVSLACYPICAYCNSPTGYWVRVPPASGVNSNQNNA